MGNLQRNVVTGNLLRVPAGNLAKECCCTVVGDCECSPSLDGVYTVTLSGFASASDTRYAHFDGDWDIEWDGGCTWSGCFDAGLKPGETSGPRYFRLIMTLDTEDCPRNWSVDFALTNSGCTPTSGVIGWKRPIETAPDCGDPCTVRPPGSDYVWYTGSGLAGNAEQSGVVSCTVV